MSQGEQIQKIRRNHGSVHKEMDKRLGKPMGRLLRELYSARQRADYSPVPYVLSSIDKTRHEAGALWKRARTDFNWLQQESAKILKNE